MIKKKAQKAAWKEPRLPKEKIAELALGIFKGEIFTSAQVRKMDAQLLPVIFMPLALFSAEQCRELAKHPGQLFCGRMSDAMPRSINGYPILHTFQMIYAQDTKLIWERVKKLEAATAEALKD